MMNVPTFSVTDINRYIKALFDTDMGLKSVFVSGEISNFSNHYKTGHLYFSLKDENASIKAVMFFKQAQRLRFKPENGMKVIVLGRISLFERDGIYQIYCEDMIPDGAGALAVAFEQLKKRLEKEGLFASEHKKQLPKFPLRIGVITSETGAAIQDIFICLRRRFPLATVIFKGVSVQGALAPSEMIAALKEFDRKKCADVIIIGRGGGSAEDLWCFNDELLARAIYDCSIPIISAVGHETDFTICDFVSDLRAPTPSAAVEIAVPDINSLYMHTDMLTQRLYNAVKNTVTAKRMNLQALLDARSFMSPLDFLYTEREQLSKLKTALNYYFEKEIFNKRSEYKQAVASLEKLNPLSVLLRGYSLVSKEGKIIETVKKINVGDSITVKLSDGAVNCLVTDAVKEST